MLRWNDLFPMHDSLLPLNPDDSLPLEMSLNSSLEMDLNPLEMSLNPSLEMALNPLNSSEMLMTPPGTPPRESTQELTLKFKELNLRLQEILQGEEAHCKSIHKQLGKLVNILTTRRALENGLDLIVARFPPHLSSGNGTPHLNSSGQATMEELGTLKQNLVFANQGWSVEETKSLTSGVIKCNQVKRFDPVSNTILGTPEDHLMDLDVDWTQISREVGSKTPGECRVFWTQCKHPSLKQDSFTKTELTTLAHLVKVHGNRDWAHIASIMGRSMIQVFQEYQRNINSNPIFKNNSWSKIQVQKLQKGVELFGLDFKLISAFIDTKNTTQVSNRWTYVSGPNLNPQFKKGRWSKEEDDQLLEIMDQVGDSWVKIASIMTSRTDMQIRDHYLNCLDPNRNSTRLSREELNLLEEWVAQYGFQWAKFAKELGRSDSQLRREWSNLHKPLVVRPHVRTKRVRLEEPLSLDVSL